MDMYVGGGGGGRGRSFNINCRQLAEGFKFQQIKKMKQFFYASHFNGHISDFFFVK